MTYKKFTIKNPIIIGILSLIVILSLAIAFWAMKNNKLVKSYADRVYPTSYVFDTDVSGLTGEELHKKLENMISKICEKKLDVTANEKKFEISYKDIDTTIDYDKFENEILNYGKDQLFFKKLKLIKDPIEKKYTFTLSYNEEKLKDFVNNIANSVDVSAQNSSINISGSSVNVSPGSNGVSLDKEDLLGKLKNALATITDEQVISFNETLQVVEPNIKTEALQSVNKKIATFETNSRSGPSGVNAAMALKNIDNSLIMPGESFSTEKAIGPTTAERGFVSSNIYINGKVEKGYGGGVCQISSTLYNTILRAGIIPTERLNHSMPVSYVPLGLDATLADGYIDLKFENPYSYPLVINSYVSNGKDIVELWSNDSVLNGVRYEPKATKLDSLNAETYLYGYNKDGQVVLKKFIDKSTYKPLPQ